MAELSPSDCLFCGMIRGAIAVEPVLRTDHVLVIRDIQPRAPVHLLVLPREHVADARQVTEADGPMLGRMFAAAAEAARREGVSEAGYRLAFNVGEAAGMTIAHLHLHVVGGRRLGPEG